MLKNLLFDKHKNFFALFFLFIGTFLYTYHLNFFTKFPGDNLDGRFNHFVLEYFYSVLIGKNESFIDGNFFYALPNTMNLSDNHWLLAPFYSLIRFLGFKEILSYQIWVYLGLIANFFVCYYVLRKFKFNALSSAIGAYLFAFNQINFERIGHIQLNLKIFIILGIWYYKRYTDTQNFKYASYILLCITLQLLCNIYLGCFFALFTFFLLLFYFSNYNINEFNKFFPKKFSYKISLPIITISIFILIIWSYPYYQAMNIYNLNKPIILVGLDFNLGYLFNSFSNPILRYFNDFFETSSPRNYCEAMYFIGFIPWFILIYFLLNKKILKSLTQFERNLLKATIAMLVFFFLEKYLSLFSLLQLLLDPFKNLRAYSRFIFVLIFIFIYFITLVINKFKFRNNWKYLQVLILVLAILEPFIIKVYYTPVKQIEDEYFEVKSKFMEKNIQKNSIIYYSGKLYTNFLKFINNQIIMMHLSNELGVKTINGYSGYNPLSKEILKSCDDLPIIFAENEKIISKITKTQFKYDYNNIISYCDF